MPYTIYASKAGRPADVGVKILKAGSSTDNFVAALNESNAIVLTDAPSSTTTTAFDKSDATSQWFASLDSSATISLRTDATEEANIDSFVLKFKEPWPMTFSSDAKALKSAFGPPPEGGSSTGGARITAPGLDAEGSVLTCGLVFSKTDVVRTTVTGLLNYAGVGARARYMPSILTDLSVTLSEPREKEKPRRNALWFFPGPDYYTTVRLHFELDSKVALQTVLDAALGGITLGSVGVICKKNVVQGQVVGGLEPIDKGQVLFAAECSVKAAAEGAISVDMRAAIEFSSGSVSLTFVLESRDALTGILQWLAELSKDSNLAGDAAERTPPENFITKMLKKQEGVSAILSRFSLRRLTIGLNSSADKDSPTLSHFGFDIEALANFGSSEDSPPAAFLLSYGWTKGEGGFGEIRGQFWADYDNSPDLDVPLMPQNEAWSPLRPVLNPAPARFIDLAAIIPGHKIEGIPDTIPSRITVAYLGLSKERFALGGAITALEREPGLVPQPYLGELSLDATFIWGESKSFMLDLHIAVGLMPSPSSGHTTPTLLKGSLRYSSKDKSWGLQASLEGLYASTLVEFFDSKSRDHVMPLIDSIVIDKITVDYTYVPADGTSSEAAEGGVSPVAIASAAPAPEKKKKPASVGTSEFKMVGKLLIAGLELDLSYQHDKKGWEFSATLNPEDREATIGSIVKGVLGDGGPDVELPEFVARTKFVAKDKDALRIDLTRIDLAKKAKPGLPTKGATGEVSNGAGDVRSEAATGEVGSGRVVGGVGGSGGSGGSGDSSGDPGKELVSFQCLVQLQVGDLAFTFAQLHSSDWGVDAPSKRLIKVALMDLPDVDVPLVGNLTQPFDEMYFLWIQDPPPKVKGSNTMAALDVRTTTTTSASVVPKQPRAAGLTRKDIDQLNSGLSDLLVVKDRFVEPKNDTDLLLGAGCHFAIITKSSSGERSCLISYDFMKPKEPGPGKGNLDKNKSKTTLALAGPLGATEVREGTDDTEDAEKDKKEDDSGASAQAPFKKKSGPLSISNIGLKYKEKKLRIQFDAAFAIGPVGFSLLGFSIGVGFESLDKMPKLDVAIEGLACVFDQPPLTIAGIIRHGNTGELDYYAGGLIVGFIPYEFQAAGFYGKATPKGAPAFTSIFVFAKLNGPLITLEFAEISGITGGFGYNSNVRLPRPEEITEFPFVRADSGLGGAQDALDALITLTDPGPAGWFQPMDDTYWAAVGMKVSAFQMLALDAVVLVQFGAAVKLCIFAVAVADIPNAKSPVKYAHVQLGIAVVVDFDYGVMKVEAQLSPTSYVLHPDCHLTGGAALYYWFDAPHADAANVGNFVFTLGGYHGAYAVPVGYPNPPRLGISWSISRSLSIRGEAYFAITPKVCMGGGRLRATFKAGPIEAWFDAFADFLINYKPFHFMAQAGISVGARFKVDFLFIHTSISVEIGAQLYLWGPPLAGRVHVDFWIASFDIDFGDGQRVPEPVDLLMFYELVLQASSQGGEDKEKPAELAAASTAGRAISGVAVVEGVEGEEGEGRDEIVEVEEEEEENPAPTIPTRPKNEGHVFLAQSGLLNPTDQPERDPTDPWTVRGGTFSFLVGCKMAINEVRFDADDGQEPHIVMTYGNIDNGLEVFAKPMHLFNPMKSSLTIEYTFLTQDGVERGQAGWQMEAHIKAVPRGLWAKYSPRDDPSGGNNNVGTLLNSADGSMPLLMGVLVTAPKPYKSRDPFPIYKIDEATLRSLDADKEFPKPTRSSEAWEPAEPFTGPEVKKQYEAVCDTWSSPGWGVGDGGQRGFVSTWASAFGWADKLPAGAAAVPRSLKKRFNKLYVAAPMIAV